MRSSGRPGGFRAARSRADSGLLTTIAAVVLLGCAVLGGMTSTVASATVSAAGSVIAAAAGPAGAVRVSVPAPVAPGVGESLPAVLADRFAGIPVTIIRSIDTQPTPLGLPAATSSATAASSPSVSTAVLLADDSIAEHAALVSGGWLDGTPGTVVVQADAAAALGLAVGSTVALGSGGASFTVVGTWRADDALDPLWLGDPAAASGRLGGAAGPFVVSEADLLALPVAATAHWTVTVPAPPDGWTAAQIEALPEAADRTGIADAIAVQNDEIVEGLSVTGDLAATAVRARTGMTSAQSLALVPTVLVGVLALIGLSRLAALLAARRRSADALLWARGAAPAQFAWWGALEGVVVAGPAGVVGTALGLGVAWLFRGAAPVVTAAVPITVAALAAGTVAVLVGSGVAGVRADAAERAGRSRTSGAVVAGAAVAVLAVVAGLAVWQLESAAASPSAAPGAAAGDAPGTAAGGPGPLAVLAPTLVLLAATAALILAATLLASRAARPTALAPREPARVRPAPPTPVGSNASVGPTRSGRSSGPGGPDKSGARDTSGRPATSGARDTSGRPDTSGRRGTPARPDTSARSGTSGRRDGAGGSVVRFLAGRTVALRASVFAAAALVVALAAGGAVYAAAVTATADAQNSVAAEHLAGADLRLALGVDSTVGTGTAGPDSSRYAALPGVATASTVLDSTATIARDEVTLLGLPASTQLAITSRETVTPDTAAPALDGTALAVTLRTDAAEATRPGVLGVRAWVADADGALSALDLGTVDVAATAADGGAGAEGAAGSAVRAAVGATLSGPLPSGPAPFHLLALDVSLARSPVEGDLTVDLTAVTSTDAPASTPLTGASQSPAGATATAPAAPAASATAPAPALATGTSAASAPAPALSTDATTAPAPAPAPALSTGTTAASALATDATAASAPVSTIDPARLSAGSVSVSAQRSTARVQVDAPTTPVPVTVTSELAAHLGLAVGDELDITPTTGRVVPTRIASVTDRIPGSTDAWTIAADLTALDRGVLVAGGSVPQANQIWIAASDSDHLAAAAVGVTTEPWSLVTREGSSSDGFTGPVVAALWASAAAAAALAVLAVIAAGALLRRSQRRERAALSALGMTARQQSRRSALQTSLTVAVAVAAGLLAGVATALLCAGPATASLVYGAAALAPAVSG